MINRIREIITTEGINASQLAEKIGIQRSTLSHILSGRNNPSLDVITKILDEYPDVSAEWLLRGVDMCEQSGEVDIQSQNELSPNPDLFSGLNTAKPKISKPERVKNAEIAPEQPVKQEDNNLKEADKETHAKYHDKGKTAYNTTTVEISAEQVMIFFSDGTFTSYKPANKKSD